MCVTSSAIGERRMTSLYNAVKDILNANESTVIVTWDTLQMFMTLLIFIALVILIWITRLDHCDKEKYEGKYEDIRAEEGVPRCVDTDNSVFV